MAAVEKIGEWLAIAGAALVAAVLVAVAFVTTALGVAGIAAVVALAVCGGLLLAALRLMVTPGGAAIVIACIGLYVWLNGGFA